MGECDNGRMGEWDNVIMRECENGGMGESDNGRRRGSAVAEQVVGTPGRVNGNALFSLLPPLSSLLTQSFHTHQQEIKFPAALVDVIREIAVEWHK